jgi:hypothetical protein
MEKIASTIFYLDQDHIKTQTSIVRLVSMSGSSVNLSKLLLVAFSSGLQKPLEDLESKEESDETVLITEHSLEDLLTITKFCSEGLLPIPLEQLEQNIPDEIQGLFWTFGIDLNKVLFGKKLKTEWVEYHFDEKDPICTNYEGKSENVIIKSEPITETIQQDHQPEVVQDIPDEDDEDIEQDDDDEEEELDDDIDDDFDDEDEPISKKRRMVRSKNHDNEDSSSSSKHFDSKTISKHNNYTQIQEKYKDYMKVIIPCIVTPSDVIKFQDYSPSKPLESCLKSKRPPSRKKKLPKNNDKYPLSCIHCPRRFSNGKCKSFHDTVYHNKHYQCPYCPNAFRQNQGNAFRKHLYTHEHVTQTSQPHECIQCGKQDYCLQRLEKHVKDFRGLFHNNQCTQCTQRFQSHQEYKIHVNKIHDGLWKYRCDDCEKVFETLLASKEHRLEVHKRKQPPKTAIPTMCDICGKVLKGSSIPNHMKLVHMSDMLKKPCPHCGRFVKELQRHIRQTHEKLPCDLCGQLVVPGHFKQHNDQYHTASEDRRHKCTVCAKGFSTKQRLNDHVNIHTGEKPYTCTYCGKGFANSSGCRLHVRCTHLGHKKNRNKK